VRVLVLSSTARVRMVMALSGEAGLLLSFSVISE
jgi:hypothetical protein